MDPSLIKDLVKEHRWVIIRNKNTIPCKELVEFYKSLGTLHVQDSSFMSDEYIEKYSEGYR